MLFLQHDSDGNNNLMESQIVFLWRRKLCICRLCWCFTRRRRCWSVEWTLSGWDSSPHSAPLTTATPLEAGQVRRTNCHPSAPNLQAPAGWWNKLNHVNTEKVFLWQQIVMQPHCKPRGTAARAGGKLNEETALCAPKHHLPVYHKPGMNTLCSQAGSWEQLENQAWERRVCTSIFVKSSASSRVSCSAKSWLLKSSRVPGLRQRGQKHSNLTNDSSACFQPVRCEGLPGSHTLGSKWTEWLRWAN